jgi:DNA invertase Pin-like site-specific DNA recombinase
MNEMLSQAKAGAFDLILAGYSDRWQRNLRRTLELLEDHLHPAGVALVMCDRRILSSDPHDRDELVAESAAAERYTLRLAERVTDGYAAKFDRHDDQAGNPPLGFRRLTEPPYTLEVDPATIHNAVALFERYAIGTVSIEQVGRETGLEPDRIRYILRNPLYNGWIRRHRGAAETRRPAAWRANPPVSDELWARVEDVRWSKTQGGGAAPERAPRSLGRAPRMCLRATAAQRWNVRRRAPPQAPRHPCEQWGRQARYGDETWRPRCSPRWLA